MSDKSLQRIDYTYKLLAIIALIITATILAREIVIPIGFAGFLSIVMLPLISRLEKRINTTVAILLVLLGTIVVIGLLLWLVVTQIVSLVNDLPNLQARFDRYVTQATQLLHDQFSISTSDQNTLTNEFMGAVRTFLGGLLLSTTNVISTLIQIPIYIFLFLIYRDKFREFFLQMVPESKESSWRQDIKRIVHGYISGLTLVTLIIAALNSLGLLILGIDHAIFFGVLSGVLTIIPYVGIIIGALFPVLMALITKDSLWYTFGVIMVFAVVQFLEGNFITPRITGSKVSINALAAIVALLLGGKILGIAGMILAVPAIGAVKIILNHTYHLKPFVILLEDDNYKALRKRGINLSKKKDIIKEEDIPDS